MAISKAFWRGFESVSEPRTASQWVWLGRSTPHLWEIELAWRIQYPPFFAWNELFPQNPGPELELVDHSYLVQYSTFTFDALAWRVAATIGTHSCDLVLMQWVESAAVRSLFMLAEGTHSICWLGNLPPIQIDARRRLYGHLAYGQGVLFGGGWTITPGFLAPGLGVHPVGPAWLPLHSDMDMSGGTAPTSFTVTWLA